ncbi:MAG: hypothetical protein C5B49_05025 [Bdellovibrio sp.]|nr:MAG: hypothetical protein C5B49_05025 [Bdellovibrio sp.]
MALVGKNSGEKYSPWSLILSLSFSLSLLLVSCAKPSSNDPAAVDPSTIVPLGTLGIATGTTGVGVNPLDSQPGSTVDVVLDGSTYQQKLQTLTAWVGVSHPLNAPSDFRMNVQLTDSGNGLYEGILMLGYYDNGAYNIDTLSTGTGTSQNAGIPATYGLPDGQFNQWFLYNGKAAFHAFFQDGVGAVILVVEGGVGVGDSNANYQTVYGSLWFKNFAVTAAANDPNNIPTDPCWFVWIGPWSCRTFLGPDGFIHTASALLPSDGYVRLGTFSGLDKVKAFGK